MALGGQKASVNGGTQHLRGEDPAKFRQECRVLET